MTKTYSQNNSNSSKDKIQNINNVGFNQAIHQQQESDIAFLKDVCPVNILDLKRGKRYFFLYSSSYLHSKNRLTDLYFSGIFFESVCSTLQYTHKNNEPHSSNGLICIPFNFIECHAYSMQKILEHCTSIPTDVIDIICEFL
jgi:hypothetical protein